VSSHYLLLDTHIWVWWLQQNPQLPVALRQQIEQFSGALAISSASLYESLWLIRSGRIEVSLPLMEWITLATEDSGIEVLPTDKAIAVRAALLPQHHGDPMDRAIIATAIEHRSQLVSMDRLFSRYEELDGLLV
jgi:PIN domain nuclease of toxin-antitoxin system